MNVLSGWLSLMLLILIYRNLLRPNYILPYLLDLGVGNKWFYLFFSSFTFSAVKSKNLQLKSYVSLGFYDLNRSTHYFLHFMNLTAK